MVRRATPPAEVEIDATLVRGLLQDQHPDLAHLPLVSVGAGWDNALYRLGSALAVRLPRRALAAPLIRSEQRWLGEIAPKLPLPIPVARRIGEPGRGYPWGWSVTPWFDGVPAGDGPLLGDQAAVALGSFLRALHTPAPEEAPRNTFRCEPLTSRSGRLAEHLRDLDGVIDTARVHACWDRLCAAAPWSGVPVWLHGDLHHANVLVLEDRIVAVIDFGDLTAGDPAVDFAAAWMLFTPEARIAFRKACRPPDCSVDESTWTRARGWALALSIAWLVQSADDERLTQQTLATIDAVLADGM